MKFVLSLAKASQGIGHVNAPSEAAAAQKLGLVPDPSQNGRYTANGQVLFLTKSEDFVDAEPLVSAMGQ